MTPGMAALNVRDHALGDSEIISDDLLLLASLDSLHDLYYRIGRQFRMAITFTVSAAMFTTHIKEIVFRCSEKQMRWIATWRIVAAVQNIHASRNWAIGNFIRQTMSEHGSSWSACTDAAVTAAVFASGPSPAFSGPVKASPKPIACWFHS
jgi:hypothetical protein